ncbi:UNVERIFIED_CONTAM: hypothetical protein FKN15_078037 [Acipenser sinensis]
MDNILDYCVSSDDELFAHSPEQKSLPSVQPASSVPGVSTQRQLRSAVVSTPAFSAQMSASASLSSDPSPVRRRSARSAQHSDQSTVRRSSRLYTRVAPPSDIKNWTIPKLQQFLRNKNILFKSTACKEQLFNLYLSTLQVSPRRSRYDETSDRRFPVPSAAPSESASQSTDSTSRRPSGRSYRSSRPSKSHTAAPGQVSTENYLQSEAAAPAIRPGFSVSAAGILQAPALPSTITSQVILLSPDVQQAPTVTSRTNSDVQQAPSVAPFLSNSGVQQALTTAPFSSKSGVQQAPAATWATVSVQQAPTVVPSLSNAGVQQAPAYLSSTFPTLGVQQAPTAPSLPFAGVQQAPAFLSNLSSIPACPSSSTGLQQAPPFLLSMPSSQQTHTAGSSLPSQLGPALFSSSFPSVMGVQQAPITAPSSFTPSADPKALQPIEPAPPVPDLPTPRQLRAAVFTTPAFSAQISASPAPSPDLSSLLRRPAQQALSSVLTLLLFLS